MNNGPLLFLGIFASVATSFWGILLVPQLQLGRQEQVINPATAALYPQARGGSAKKGAEVYRALGCVECHSQQVRGSGVDRERGWGERMTVAQDYLGDYPVLIGAQRVGPDLANIGFRQTSVPELLRHLYSPQLVTPGSMMPPYHFLFEKRALKENQPASAEAVVVESANGRRDEIVPSQEARALADYLVSLRTDARLYEAPFPKSATNVTESASTNAPTAGLDATNSAASTNGTQGG